jgi:16S rRNA (cytosine1402-N4)-methyltransferase
VDTNWIGVTGNFRNIKRIVEEANLGSVQGIVFDLGLSSNQLDDEKRGFSYRIDAPLDMRFDTSQELTAWKVVNTYQKKLLYEIFATFGEEQHSERLAHAICVARSLKKIDSTFELIQVAKEVVGVNFKALGRIFQAIRMEVNDEMNALKEGLHGADQVLTNGGILSVVSFHSLEDRIVKQFIRTHTYRILTKKPIVPGEKEMIANSRSHSAKLRVGQKVE